MYPLDTVRTIQCYVVLLLVRVHGVLPFLCRCDLFFLMSHEEVFPFTNMYHAFSLRDKWIYGDTPAASVRLDIIACITLSPHFTITLFSIINHTFCFWEYHGHFIHTRSVAQGHFICGLVGPRCAERYHPGLAAPDEKRTL